MRGNWRWAVIGAGLLTSGCGSNWSQVAVAPTALDGDPGEVRVTLEGGRRVVVAMPRIERDSLLGDVDGMPWALALTDVRRLALPEASSNKRSAGTVAVVAALAVFAAGWLFLILANQ